MSAPDLIHTKWGTHVAACDEPSDELLTFVFDATKDTAKEKGWKMLPGAFERQPAGRLDGDEVFAYLWPVARPAARRGGEGGNVTPEYEAVTSR